VAPAPVRRSLWHDRNGGLTAIVAVALTVIVGMLGLGVEVGLWYAGKRSLQTAADAAALSGALERAKGNPAGVLVAARQEAARNSFNGELPHTILVRNPP